MGQNAEEEKPLVVGEKPLPFHTHAVQVDAFIKVRPFTPLRCPLAFYRLWQPRRAHA
jgi:hypothetical protein